MHGTTPDQHALNLEQTHAALEGGVTGLSIDAALQMINLWHAEVLAEDEMDLTDVADGLGELRDLLSADSIDGPAVGGVLVRLGEATQVAAQNAADARLTPLLERLATLLSRGGNALAGFRERSSASDPDQGVG